MNIFQLKIWIISSNNHIDVIFLVVHSIQCDSCLKERFSGFRYRCLKCPHYTLCQDCFWRGRVSSPHTLDHQVKEYASFVSIFIFDWTENWKYHIFWLINFFFSLLIKPLDTLWGNHSDVFQISLKITYPSFQNSQKKPWTCRTLCE